jgi:hypothetical protein
MLGHLGKNLARLREGKFLTAQDELGACVWGLGGHQQQAGARRPHQPCGVARSPRLPARWESPYQHASGPAAGRAG